MKLQMPLKNNGFTLIEVMIVIIILCSFFLIGFFVDQGMYSRKSLQEEELLVISILQKARSRAMNNIYESNHGLHIEDNSYVIFKTTPYVESNLTNEKIPRNNKISITAGLELLDEDNEIEIIFTRLSGDPINTGGIKLDDNLEQKYININKRGLIDW